MGLTGFVGRMVMRRVGAKQLNRPNRVQALLRLPTLLRLAYNLFRDERVPLWQRAGVLGLLALIFSPVDVVGNIPVVGQFWDISLAVVVLERFFQVAPAHVVNEHIRKLRLEKKVPLRPE